MKRIVIGLAAAMSLFATGALAADLAARPYVKAPIVDPVWSWTGWYVGANAGYSWGRSRSNASFFDSGTGAPIAPPAGSITSASFDMNGAIAGGQAGYNWQRANWVFGIEGDLQWSDEKGRAAFSCVGTAAAPVAGPCLPTFTFLPPGGLAGTTLAIDQKLQWFGTVRGRVGILATPKVLFYGTGGLAFGEIKTTGTLSSFTTVAPFGPIAAVGSSIDHARRLDPRRWRRRQDHPELERQARISLHGSRSFLDRHIHAGADASDQRKRLVTLYRPHPARGHQLPVRQPGGRTILNQQRRQTRSKARPRAGLCRFCRAVHRQGISFVDRSSRSPCPDRWR